MTTAYGLDAAAAGTLLSALRNRRTCRSFTSDLVPRHVIEAMLEAARWAPNHRLTNPWRFFVVDKAGAARQEIARLVREWTYDNVKNPSPERRVQSADAALREILDAPALLYAFSAPGADDEITAENFAATCCAVQNLQLAAYAYGVGVGWSTGKPAKPPGLPAVLGADASWRLVGALFAGYPAQELRQERKPVSDVATWR